MPYPTVVQLLGDVPPDRAMDDAPNARLGYTVKSRQLGLTSLPSSVSASDSDDIRLSQTAMPIQLTRPLSFVVGFSPRLAFCRSPLADHIRRIILRGADKKVIRSDAKTIIARVTEKVLWWDRANSEFVGKAMGAFGLVVPYIKAAISAGYCTFPDPTVTRSINGREESLLDRGSDRLISHRNRPFGAIGPAATNSAGLQSVNYSKRPGM